MKRILIASIVAALITLPAVVQAAGSPPVDAGQAKAAGKDAKADCAVTAKEIAKLQKVQAKQCAKVGRQKQAGQKAPVAAVSGMR